MELAWQRAKANSAAVQMLSSAELGQSLDGECIASIMHRSPVCLVWSFDSFTSRPLERICQMGIKADFNPNKKLSMG